MSLKGNWGFPRWGGYGKDTDATAVRMCDYHGCSQRGEHPAPKSPNSPERWWFCEQHAAQYNKNWNYFQGLSAEEARASAEAEARVNAGYAEAGTYAWGGAPDAGGRTPVEREALEVLELEGEPSEHQIKARFRELAKRYHPDQNPGDAEAEARFQRIRAAYDLLSMRQAPGR